MNEHREPKPPSQWEDACSNSSQYATSELKLIGESPAIRQVRAQIAQMASKPVSVLITGETGTGKEIVARLLHHQSQRSSEPFIPLNCGSVSDTLIESELFGHVKGAFTGAIMDHKGLFLAAGKGTVFLDEVNAMPFRLQTALLRVLEQGEIRAVGSSHLQHNRARVIAAGNDALDEAIKTQKFRADLYFRLARCHICLPPLRERMEDIPLLAQYFLQNLLGTEEVQIQDGFLQALSAYSWPGNVRQLRNAVEVMSMMVEDTREFNARLFTEFRSRPSTRLVLQQSPISGPLTEDGMSPATPRKRRAPWDRRERLRELFQERSHLTRADVVEILQVSPNTATGYLKVLEAEGCIRRVCTSGNLRTSYFVWQGKSDVTELPG
jgi:DNA-binding NtrC family response regulator